MLVATLGALLLAMDPVTPPARSADAADDRWCCYLLVTSSKRPRTYVGATPDLARRLRQHNGEIGGGARYTRMARVAATRQERAEQDDGESEADGDGGARAICWRVACVVRGFETQRQALQFEWAAKHVKKARGRGFRSSGGGLRARVQHLEALLAAERWTAQAPPAADVPLVLEWHARDAARPKGGLRLPAHVRETFAEDADL